MSSSKNENNVIWKNKLITALQENWMVQLHLNKRLKPKNHIDISAGNVQKITDEGIVVRYRMYHVIPKLMKIAFTDFVSVKAFLRRRSPLTNSQIANLSDKNSITRKRELRRADLRKWLAIITVLIAIFGMATIIIVFGVGKH